MHTAMTNSKHHAQTSQQTPPFKPFPEFTRLTLSHREPYVNFIKQFPPISDISFAKIIDWWEYFGDIGLSELNGNLVVSYENYTDERALGLSLVGSKDIDSSICQIFDYLREQGHPVRLVNVPEFVVNQIDYPEMFKFTPSYRDDEYVLELSGFANIENFSVLKRSKIKRFMQNNLNKAVEVKPIDIDSPANRKKLLGTIDDWPKKGVNDLGGLETRILQKRISSKEDTSMRNVCIFIDGELQSHLIYYVLHDKTYIMISHCRVNYSIPGMFDYMTYAFSKYFTDQGFKYANIHSDLDSVRMRVLKIALKPAKFFRKYVVEPGD